MSAPALNRQIKFKLIAKYGSGKAIATIASLTLLSIFSKNLDPVSFITITVAQSTGYLAILFGNMGQSQVIFYTNGRDHRNVKYVDHLRKTTNAYKIILTYGIFSCAIASILLMLFTPENNFLFFTIYFLWVLSLSIQMFNGEHCKSQNADWLSSLFGTAGGNNGAGGALIALISVTIILFSNIKLDLIYALASFLVGSLISNLIFFFFFFRNKLIRYVFAWSSINFNVKLLPQLKIGLKGILNALSVLILGQFDIFLAVILFPREEVSDYIVAANIAKFVSMPGMLVTSALANKILYAIRISGANNLKIFNSLIFLNILASIVTYLIIILLLHFDVIEHFFSIKNQIFYEVLNILLVGHLLASAFLFGPLILTTTGNFKYTILINFSAVIFLSFLSILLSPNFGIYTVATASAGAIIATQFFSTYISRKLRTFR